MGKTVGFNQNVHLAKCGSSIAQLRRDEDSIVVMARILTQGEYTDMNGTKVIVDEDTLTKLVLNFNNKTEEEYLKHKQLVAENANKLDPNIVSHSQMTEIEEFDWLPNQIDHNTSTVRATVGNIVGKMELRQSMGKMAIFANLKVKGRENVVCVADNRWRNLSVQYNPKTHEWVEVSWVVYGADPDANKVMSAPIMTQEVSLSSSDEISRLMNDCNQTIYSLERKILIDKSLLGLCKLRKITKADAYFIEKEINGIKDISAISKIFNILDMQLSIPKKEKFIEMDKKTTEDLHNLLKAATYDNTYSTPNSQSIY